MHRIAILLSGRGSNFLAVHQAIVDGRIPDAEIVTVLSDKADAPGLAAARALGLPTHHVASKGPARDAELLRLLALCTPDLICLAGYMRILSPSFIAAYSNRIVNIHPSLLPSFPGLDAQAQALEFGAKVAGCTVHWVDERVDHGVIILQRAVAVQDEDTVETLAARILIEEHQAYPEAIARVLSGRYQIRGRRYLLSQQGQGWTPC